MYLFFFFAFFLLFFLPLLNLRHYLASGLNDLGNRHRSIYPKGDKMPKRGHDSQNFV